MALAMFTASSALLAPAALAQSGELRPFLDRMERLERDIRTLNQQLFRGAAPRSPAQPGTQAPPSSSAVGGPTPAIARFEVRLNAIEEELRAATGAAETATHQMDQLKQRLEKLIADVDFRLSALERAGARMSAAPGQAPGAAPPQVAGVPSPLPVEKVSPRSQGFATQPGSLGTIRQSDVDGLKQQGAAPGGGEPAAPAPQVATAPAPAPPPSILPKGSPKDRYTFAFGLLRQAQYVKAEAALREFLQVHGDDPLAGNARYWLGETHYVRGEYSRAARVFLEGYRALPKGAKAPDTLLKLGMSLANLEKKNEACATFSKLIEEYPDISGSISKKVEQQRARIKCP